jgi:HlyD family secretion protein
LVIAAAAVVYFSLKPEQEIQELGSTFTVARGDLLVSVTEGGNLKAKKSVKIECEVEGRATIVSLVPEGTFVKEGDMLVELDSSDLEERFTQQEISYNSAEADLVQARESLAIQEIQNDSDIKTADLNVEFAQKDLEKYQEGDWPQELRTMEDEIKLAEEELKLAQNRCKWTQDLYEKDYVTSDELEADKLTLQRREISLLQARKRLELAQKYDKPMQEKKLRSDLEEFIRERERIKRRAASQLAQREADLKSREAQFKLQKERFDKLKEQLANCTIKAPQDGLVVYGEQDGDHRWGRGDSNIVEEGAEVRFRQTLITLPDVSIMMVDTKVHESSVNQVERDLEALVTVDAFPDLQFRGTVTKVAILPDSQSRWLNPDLKVYSTDITLDDRSDKLKPGMSAMVEIIVKRLIDVVYVPVQSVYRRGNREVCYVTSPMGDIEIRPVEVGLDNDQFVEILDGVEVGEMVLLYPPAIGEDLEEVEEKAEGEDRPEGGGEGPTAPMAKTENAPFLTEGTIPPAKKPDPEAMQRVRPEGAEPGGAPMSRRGMNRGGGAGPFGSLDSEEAKKAREKWMNMTPEERKKEMEKMMKQGGGPGQGGRGGDRRGRRDQDRSEGGK